ncbi:hypothetical protein Sango_0256000 [Sesamum angolense]|uniref:Retrotransposon gag domain-containing protein n=1 Tax=Sesamum angolense TaxID=2727404 RepID=A0AAE2C7S7_9LAMI|nr:hypothetical protein Sango_0256000 [Sesamum angolense]
MAENKDKGVAKASDDNLGQMLQGGVDAFHMQALVNHFEKLLDLHNECLKDPSDGEEYEDIRPRKVNWLRDRPRRPREEDVGLGGVKITIPSFKGKSDLEVYLEWEMRVEQIFSWHNHLESKKVKLAALGLTNHALVWWDQMRKERVRN